MLYKPLDRSTTRARGGERQEERKHNGERTPGIVSNISHVYIYTRKFSAVRRMIAQLTIIAGGIPEESGGVAANGCVPTLNLVQRPARPTPVARRARKFN